MLDKSYLEYMLLMFNKNKTFEKDFIHKIKTN